ncbi:MAG: gatC [Desulfomicrobiaceae bacterium]|jgi:aspartyl-tRNA(Asn)/glutamyl-tRNA(Gln) amidotransferase subunit C|nr:Asp-tRNA(Asn)/Glu-tRNA(Gln) amidotransferase subunit GatC [Desulfomicrobiaceae bacterium]MBZ4685606.1 gatC [Desulfomicrobiaceae bacterium]MDI3492304.1 aspartyl-tRNA(Asn)/glutamyl-tRNA(Gln) amidotransferase subunit [Desulfomicrobiaceae bacterium]MDK2873248.1 aspartyl-tRNA(Asn)/glutamyl-tRNA(Gln) amidotransferase subunit [Desulfomicrobiaceae bacterium]HCF05494.1 Asp-tRNA(Asn)/Glu-tRNA(Gln) amidotransferase GatCAB subunit C [Desulfomicrobiaceae bacterium]
MRLTAADAKSIAALARLAITEEDAAHLALQMGKILDYMDTLNQVDTTDVEPLYSPVEHVSVLRDDCACATSSREAILANAPASDGVYFLVPRVIA